MFKCFVYFRSMEFNDFLKKALDRNPEMRPTAAQLLEVRNFTHTLVISLYTLYYSHVKLNVKAFQDGMFKRTCVKETTAERLIKAFVASCPTG